MAKIQQAVGRSAPYVSVLPPPVIAQRAPTTTDTNYAKGQRWLDESPSVPALYDYLGGGVWQAGGNAVASTTVAGIVMLDADLTDGAAADTVPTSAATKDYVDGVAIAGAPVATEAVQGIGELASDAEAVAGTPSTALKALFVTPSNLAPVFAAPGAIGGTTPAAGTFTDLVADSTLAITLDADAASRFNVDGAGIDLTLSSGLGRVVVNAEEAAADALRLLSAAGGLDVDVALQMNLTSSQNAADAIRLNASAGGIDIDAAGAAGEDINIANAAGSVVITAGESAANSLVLESTAGGIDILASGAAAGEDIDIVATGSSVNISSSEGVANAINIDASSGGVDVDAAGQVNIASSQNAADAVVIIASAGGVDITATGTAGEDLDLLASGSSVNISATEDAARAMYLHIDGGVSETMDLHVDQGTGVASLNLHSDVGGVTIESGLASADAININASDAAGGIDVDCGSGGFIVDAAAGAVSLDSALASNFTVTGAADLTLSSTAGSIVVNAEEAAADALRLLSAAGGLDADVALQMNLASSQNAADAIVISASAGGIDITATGGAAEDLDLVCTSGSTNISAGEAAADAITVQAASGGLDVDVALQMSLVSSQAATDAIVLDASNAAGGIDVDCGSGGFIVDAAAGAVSLDSALASNFTVTGAADLTLQSTAGSVIVSASESAVDALQLLSTAGGIDILASGAAAGEDIDIVATGSSVNITATESVSDAIVIDASGAAGAIQLNSGTGGVVFDSGITVNVAAKTNADTPYTVLGGDYYIAANTAAGVLTITLPAAPATGRELVIYDAGGNAAVNNVTIGGNGNNIAMSGTSAASKLLAAAYSSVSMVYNGTIWMARYTA